MKMKDLETGRESGSCGVGPGKALRSFVVATLGHFSKHEVYIMTIISQLTGRWKAASRAVLHVVIIATRLKTRAEREWLGVSSIEFTAGSGLRSGHGPGPFAWAFRSPGFLFRGGVPPPTGAPRYRIVVTALRSPA
jgi:hypothetical protein